MIMEQSAMDRSPNSWYSLVYIWLHSSTLDARAAIGPTLNSNSTVPNNYRIERLEVGTVHMCLSSVSGYRPLINPPPSLGNLLLGRLPKVDLIILEGGKCLSVRPSVRPSTKSFFDFNEIWYVGRGR